MDEGSRLRWQGLPTHGIHQLVDHLAGLGTDHACSDDGPTLDGDDFDVTLVLALDDRPTNTVEGVFGGLHLQSPLGGLGLGDPDFGHLGVGVGDTGMAS